MLILGSSGNFPPWHYHSETLPVISSVCYVLMMNSPCLCMHCRLDSAGEKTLNYTSFAWDCDNTESTAEKAVLGNIRNIIESSYM